MSFVKNQFASSPKLLPKPVKPAKADRPKPEFSKALSSDASYKWAGKQFNSFLEIFKYLPRGIAYGFGGQTDEFRMWSVQRFAGNSGTDLSLIDGNTTTDPYDTPLNLLEPFDVLDGMQKAVPPALVRGDLGDGTKVWKSMIPATEFDKVKFLFVDPTSEVLIFKPIKETDIDKIGTTDQVKTILHRARVNEKTAYQKFVDKYGDHFQDTFGVNIGAEDGGGTWIDGRMGDFHWQNVGQENAVGGMGSGGFLKNINFYDPLTNFNHIRENKDSSALAPDFNYMNADSLDGQYIFGKTWSKMEVSKFSNLYSLGDFGAIKNDINAKFSGQNVYEIALNKSYTGMDVKTAFELMILLNESRRRFYAAMTEIFGDPKEMTGPKVSSSLMAKSDAWVKDPNKGAGINPYDISMFQVFLVAAQPFMNAIEAFFKKDGGEYISSTQGGFEVPSIRAFRTWLYQQVADDEKDDTKNSFWEQENDDTKVGSLAKKIKDENAKGNDKNQSLINNWQAQLDAIKAVIDEWNDHAAVDSDDFGDKFGNNTGSSPKLPHGMSVGYDDGFANSPLSTAGYRGWDSWNNYYYDAIPAIPSSLPRLGLRNIDDYVGTRYDTDGTVDGYKNILWAYNNEWPTHNFYNAYNYINKAIGLSLSINLTNRRKSREYKQEMKEYYELKDDLKEDMQQDAAIAAKRLAEQKASYQKMAAQRQKFEDDLKRMQAAGVDRKTSGNKNKKK